MDLPIKGKGSEFSMTFGIRKDIFNRLKYLSKFSWRLVTLWKVILKILYVLRTLCFFQKHYSKKTIPNSLLISLEKHSMFHRMP